MKRFILSALPVLLLSTVAVPAVQAQITPEAPPENAETIGMAVTPFNLVFLAYQGFFEEEGIPKFDGLIIGYQENRVTAEDLVRVAIAMRRLPADAVTDNGYLRAVDRQLNALYAND
jgi:hypothetical protein